MQYPVNEIFQTIQGEGQWTGVPAIFVRLQGCPVGCPWCDTRHTWELQPENAVAQQLIFQTDGQIGRWSKLTAADIIDGFKAQQFTAKHVVITGGEPCMYDLRPLTSELHAHGFSSQIETSGTFEVQCANETWVTVSPKVNMQGKLPVLTTALQRANEIKHPVATEHHIEELEQLLATIDTEGKTICLQPISQKARATELAMRVCIERNWRLSVQTHKYLQID
ncbi:7-carboxy-7-deazaguanine synthase QueE [Shewanella avicenniae]|uniref:7-carboxy-7-deazaguanine synthase n=1 Tax=Shewanella avicenniae TaxID=2814294 RepID=A0ABX7QUH4_9GAMM|nr:7-carboxy-7-deazaguanine synthase QueE [Shewanella avicenniae]QSX35142.1 7-carboxy-7-deazaguanine synthase QueE [Shewanella avicenniae]